MTKLLRVRSGKSSWVNLRKLCKRNCTLKVITKGTRLRNLKENFNSDIRHKANNNSKIIRDWIIEVRLVIQIRTNSAQLLVQRENSSPKDAKSYKLAKI
jgi:hypothetical protein